MTTRQLYLNGRWTAPGEPIEVVNPATEEPLGRVATVDRDGVRRALGDAHAALGPWRPNHLPPMPFFLGIAPP